MKFSKLDLLTLLISLFIFASCENTSTIGLEVDPTNAVQGNLIDSVTINSRTVAEEDEVTYASGNGLARYPLGYLNDPLLGQTESSVAMVVNLPFESFDFGKTPVLDSAVLVMNYSSEFYGDSTSKYSIDVHQLTNNLNKETSYLSSKNYPFENTLLANYTGKVFPTKPFKVIDVLQAAPDTLKTVKPQLRLKIDPTFITDNIVSLSALNLKRNIDFQEAFKGLHVSIKQSSKAAMGIGGIMFFDFGNSANSALTLYYRRQNANNATLKDTLSVAFPISTNLGAVASSVKHTYSAAVQAQLSAPNVQQSVTYLKPLGGLRNKLTFPYLGKLKTSVGNLVVNKAELVIDIGAGTDVGPFKAAPRLVLYRNDIAGQRKNIPDNDRVDGVNSGGDRRANPAAFGGYFDSVKKRYVFSVTAYVQDLIDHKTEDYGTYLAVTPSSSFQFTPSFNVAARAVLSSFKKNSVAADQTMKLNIYYTKIN